jgi:hypothetical protein
MLRSSPSTATSSPATTVWRHSSKLWHQPKTSSPTGMCDVVDLYILCLCRIEQYFQQILSIDTSLAPVEVLLAAEAVFKADLAVESSAFAKIVTVR